MHDDELTITEAQVRGLLADQVPHLADLPLRPLPHRGTDHALFRLGQDLAVRLPRIAWAAGCVERERDWTRDHAAQVPWEAPLTVHLGEPGHGFPWRWAVCRWVHGAPPTAPDDRLAADVARLVADLRVLDPVGGPPARRSHPLADLDDAVRRDAAAVGDELDTAAVLAAWAVSRDADPWDGAGVWLHGDLAPGNLVVRDGRLVGALDWGGAGVGDPAADLAVAWNLFTAPQRAVLRAALPDPGPTWLRARGWALAQALVQLPYYRTRYVPLAEHARATIREVLADAGATVRRGRPAAAG